MTPRRTSLLLSLVALLTFWGANRLYAETLPPLDLPYLEPHNLMQSDIGAPFEVEGRVERVWTHSSGLITLYINDTEYGMDLAIPIFPSLGQLPLSPAAGDTVFVEGDLAKYRESWQIKPFSINHIQIRSEVTSLSDALPQLGEHLLIGPVRGVRANEFVAKRSGKRHLRLSVSADGQVVNGIMWQGSWDERDKALLHSGKPLRIHAEVDQYKGRPSLIVSQIQPVP